MREGRFFVFLLAVVVAIAAFANPASAAKKALIFGPSMATDVPTNEQAVAVSAGFQVTVVSAGQWAAMTTAQFAAYNLIIIGDDACENSTPGLLAPLNQNKSVWSPAITGPIVLNTLDPVYHATNGQGPAGPKLLLLTNAFNAAAKGPGTGLYAHLGCWYLDLNGADVDFMSWVGRVSVVPYESDKIIIHLAGNPVVAGLSASSLSNWDQSAHGQFTNYPDNFNVVLQSKGTVCSDCEIQPMAPGDIKPVLLYRKRP